jgi:hypothetical protein
MAGFGCSPRALSRLVDFAKEGHLRLLTTDITKREVRSHLQESLNEAINAAKKHAIVLRQLDAGNVIQIVSDSEAITKLEAAFSTFLKATKAIDVPIAATMDEIFSDYFSRRPPFSDRKRREFPDAVVVASLRAWCAKRQAKAYIVSGDPDLKACCSDSGPLLFAASIEDIISQATVSSELRGALQEAISEDEALIELLSDQLRELAVRAPQRFRYSAGIALLSGIVRNVDDISIHQMNVLERDGINFTCEIVFEAGLVLDLEVEAEERYRHECDAYEPSQVYSIERHTHRIFVAEIVVNFNPKAQDYIEVESVSVSKENVEIDIDDLEAY